MPDDSASRPSASGDVPAEDLLLVGRVLKAHGTRGEVKVIPETDDPARFEPLETIRLGRTPAQASPRTIASVRHQTTKRGPLVLLGFEGLTDRYEADALRGQQVYAAAGDLPPLEEDEAFIHDLVGLAVVDEAGTHLGTVEGVESTPAHDVFVIARHGQSEGNGDPVLLPAVEAFVVAVDLDAERLVVRPIEGLF